MMAWQCLAPKPTAETKCETEKDKILEEGWFDMLLPVMPSHHFQSHALMWRCCGKDLTGKILEEVDRGHGHILFCAP